MAQQNKIYTNFSNGEISPKVTFRQDIDSYLRSVEISSNFLPMFQGPLTFRTGSSWIEQASVRSGVKLIPFVYRDTQAYQIEMCVINNKLNLRIMKDAGVLLYSAGNSGWKRNNDQGDEDSDSEGVGYTSDKGAAYNPSYMTICRVDSSASCTFDATGHASGEDNVVVKTSHGLSDGTELYFINSADDLPNEMDEYKSYYVVNASTDYFQISETLGGDVFEFTDDGTGATTYYTFDYGDEVTLVVDDKEYLSSDLDIIQWAQNADALLITCKNRWLIQIWRGSSSETAWAVNPAQVTGGNEDFSDFNFHFNNITEFVDPDNDTYPECIAFHESRLYFANDDVLYGSRSVADGIDNYVDFDVAATAVDTDAVEFIISVSPDKVDLFKWLRVVNKTFYGGMENMLLRISGEDGGDDPIAGDSIRAQSAEDRGVAKILPVSDGVEIIYVDSGKEKIQVFRYDIATDSYRSFYINILADHMLSDIKRVVFQRGELDIIWVLRNDGKLKGCVYNSIENIHGWFSYVDGDERDIKDISVAPAENGKDRLWLVVDRPDSSSTTHEQIEQLDFIPQWVRRDDFYSGDETEDDRRYHNALAQQQRIANAMLDSKIYYNGFENTEDNSYYLHLQSVDGDPNTITGIFVSTAGTTATKLTATSPLNDKENRYIIIASDTETGLGEGLYKINTVSNGQVSVFEEKNAVADYTRDDTEDAFIIPPGEWSLSINSLTSSSLARYYNSEGGNIDAVLDGGTVDPLTITYDGSNYSVSFGDVEAAVVYLGYKYTGVAKLLNVDIGGQTGTAFSKLKNIADISVGLINTNSLKCGSDLYNLDELIFRTAAQRTDYPVPLFSGIKEIPGMFSNWQNKKSIYFVQDNAQPCTICSVDVTGDAADE